MRHIIISINNDVYSIKRIQVYYYELSMAKTRLWFDYIHKYNNIYYNILTTYIILYRKPQEY